MTRPLIVDTFPINDEMDLLECRLTEIYDVVDWVVAVEADVTHQDAPKPYHLTENLSRFAAFKHKLIVVRATGLPTMRDDPDPWAREHAQREHIATGLHQIGVKTDDVILQSDVDEIPRALPTRNCRPQGLIAFGMRGHFWAIDYLYPEPWMGTVAGRAGTIRALGQMPFGYMRDARNKAPCPPAYRDAGWHLSWLARPGKTTGETAIAKVGSYCHPEVTDRIVDGLANDDFFGKGWHVDGKKLKEVDVDESWPKWVRDGNAPASWYRPRAEVAA